MMEHQRRNPDATQDGRESPASTKRTSRAVKPRPVDSLIDSGRPVLTLRRKETRSVQASLAVSEPEDRFEREADEVARKVVDGQPAEIHATTRGIERQGSGVAEVTPAFESRLERTKGGGLSLPRDVRWEMGRLMGTDFSDIRIHTGNEAHDLNRNVNARAFTHGSDIYFGNGNYNPFAASGKKLLAHELTHTVQQKGGLQRKIQRYSVKEALSDVLDVTGVKSTAQTVSDVYHYAADSDEEFQKYMQAQLKAEIDELNASSSPSIKFKAAYYAMVGVAATTNPFGVFMMPSVEALWSLYVKGKLGYFHYLYNLGNEFIPQKGPQGKTQTVKNVAYQKGGYAKVFGNQLKNMVNPMLVWGEVKGIFKGIGKWFTDLWEMIEWIGSFIKDSVMGSWNLIVNQEVPPWMKAVEEAATSAAEWLQKNISKLAEFAAELIKDKDGLKAIGKDLKAALKSGAEQMAYSAGAGMAKEQVSVMSMSAEQQGEKLGKVIGYLIPEVVIAIFSETILNWLKGGIKALQAFWKAVKSAKIVAKLFEEARAVFEGFGKLATTIKNFAGGKFKQLGEAFEKLLNYFKGFERVEKEIPKGILEEVPKKKPTALGEHLPEGKKKPHFEEPEAKKKKPGSDEATKLMALAEAKIVLTANNVAGGSLTALRTELEVVNAEFAVVKRFDFQPAPDGGTHVWMIASSYYVGKSKAKASYLKQQSNVRADKTAQSFDDAGGHSYEKHSSTKTDKWLKDRASGKIEQPVGDAATKFKNPNTHVKTVKILERQAHDILDAGPPYPVGSKISSIPKAGDVISLRKVNMGFETGGGFYSQKGALKYGKNLLDPTGPLEGATAVFEIIGVDASTGRYILKPITAYPEFL